MKTKELIRRLQSIGPDGTMEIRIGKPLTTSKFKTYPIDDCSPLPYGTPILWISSNNDMGHTLKKGLRTKVDENLPKNLQMTD